MCQMMRTDEADEITTPFDSCIEVLLCFATLCLPHSQRPRSNMSDELLGPSPPSNSCQRMFQLPKVSTLVLSSISRKRTLFQRVGHIPMKTRALTISNMRSSQVTSGTQDESHQWYLSTDGMKCLLRRDEGACERCQFVASAASEDSELCARRAGVEIA